MKLETWISLTALVTSAIGLLWTTRLTRKSQRLAIVREYTNQFLNDPAMQDLASEIDYERFRFEADSQTWLGHSPEQQLVRLLEFFNSIGMQARTRELRARDLHGYMLGNSIVRTYDSPEVRGYLGYLDAWDMEHLGTGGSFEAFRELAAKLQVLNAQTRERAGKGPGVVSRRTRSPRTLRW